MSDKKSASQQQDSTPEFALMNQLPPADVPGQSPLHHAGLENLAQVGSKEGGIVLRERKLLGHLTLRCDAANKKQLAAVKKVLGVALPTQPLTSAEQDDCVVRWISPDEWLITVAGEQAFDIESKLRETMPGHFSIVNGSGGMTILDVSGAPVVDLLKKCIVVDLHDKSFPIGKVVSTVFAKTGAIVRRKGGQEFELIIRRSFADYIWLWLQDASREFGLTIAA